MCDYVIHRVCAYLAAKTRSRYKKGFNPLNPPVIFLGLSFLMHSWMRTMYEDFNCESPKDSSSVLVKAKTWELAT